MVNCPWPSDTAEGPFRSSTRAHGKIAHVESLTVPAIPPTCARAGLEKSRAMENASAKEEKRERISGSLHKDGRSTATLAGPAEPHNSTKTRAVNWDYRSVGEIRRRNVSAEFPGRYFSMNMSPASQSDSPRSC